MKFLVLGINPSGKNKELPEDFDENINFNTNSPSDKILNGAFKKLEYKRNVDYNVTDIIRLKMTNNKFGHMDPEEKLKLAEDNALRIIKKVEEFKPKFILLLSVTNGWFKNFLEYLDSLEKQIKIPIVKVWHPCYVVRKGKSIEEYVEHIKSRIKEGCGRCDGK